MNKITNIVFAIVFVLLGCLYGFQKYSAREDVQMRAAIVLAAHQTPSVPRTSHGRHHFHRFF